MDLNSIDRQDIKNHRQYIESPADSSSSPDSGSAQHLHPKKRTASEKCRETRQPIYKGMKKRDSGKWVCEVREREPTAAKAHEAAATTFKNYEDSSWHSASADGKDIQKAAESFRSVEVYSGYRKPKAVEHTMPEGPSIVDEDDVFCLPELVMNMAEGLMLPPPHYLGYNAESEGDELDNGADLSLWNH